ncbi:MAG: NAD(P) transhydrogenase subunit alpha [Planctomycetota bacterium]|nr:NAD(P) transhydrogenase subunit alpha [Planctomycetota bacterium]
MIGSRSFLPAMVAACATVCASAGSAIAAAPEVSVPDVVAAAPALADTPIDYIPLLFVFMLASFIGIGVIRRVSRLLHTPLMSLTNAISAIAVVGSIMIAGGEHYPNYIRLMGSITLFASMTNIISGFMITNRMLKMFKAETPAGAQAGSQGGKP